MTGIFIKALMKGGSKVSPTIKSVKPGTGLTTKRAIQDKTVKAVDEGTKKALKGAPPSQSIKQSASKMKRDESKKLKGVSYDYDRLTKKFTKEKAKIEKKKKIKTAAEATAVGSGTVAAGLAFKKIKEKRVKKMGGGMMGRRMGYSQGSNGSKKSSLGMQSVIHGLDKNPDVTKADPKAKFIARAKKVGNGKPKKKIKKQLI